MIFLAFVGSTFIGILSGLLRTLVVQYYWLWFIMPVFGIAVPSFFMLFALLYFINIFKSSSYSESLEQEERTKDWSMEKRISHGLGAIIYSTSFTLTFWGIGWILHTFLV